MVIEDVGAAGATLSPCPIVGVEDRARWAQSE